MAITGYLYDSFPLSACKKLINDLSSGSTTVKVALCTSSYTPSQSGHTTFDDITNEVTGTGYTAGGVALTTKTCVASSQVTTFDADNPSWADSTITARYAIIYDATVAGAGNQYLIGYWDFGQDYSTTASTIELVFHASGIFTITVS